MAEVREIEVAERMSIIVMRRGARHRGMRLHQCRTCHMRCVGSLPSPLLPHRFAHLVDSVPRGARWAVVLLRGKVSERPVGGQRAGGAHISQSHHAPFVCPQDRDEVRSEHYGTKFACAELAFVPSDRKKEFCGVSSHRPLLQSHKEVAPVLL